MLHSSNRDKKYNLNQLSSTTSPSFSYNRSHLTAELQDAGNGSFLPGQLSPGGQVDDLAIWGVNNNQFHSPVDTTLEGSNWKSNPRSIDPFPTWGLASSNKPQFDQRPASNNAPWSHYRALSAPETDFAGGSGHHGGVHEALQPSITSTFPAKSIGGSWNTSHPFGTANISPLAYDDSLTIPIENEKFLSRPHRMQPPDHSRSSSFSKGNHTRSQLDHPISSNHSVEEEAIQDGMDLSMEGIDCDETADIPLGEEAWQTYQPDLADILSGLKSPFQQRQNPQSGVDTFYTTEEQAKWPVSDTAAGGSLEGMTEPFPDLFQSENYSTQGPNHDHCITNSIPIPTSSDKFQGGLTSSYPPTNHHWPPNLESELPSTPDPSQTFGRPRGFTVSTAHPLVGETQRPTLPISNKSNKSKPPSVSRRSRKSSLNEGKKSVPLTRVGSGVRRGVRDGQLPHAKALEIAQKRESKIVCIVCKSARVTCQADTPEALQCNKCLKLGSSCVRANFAEMTDSQTCNPIFQTSCMHITQDARRRVTLPYSYMIDADWLLSQLAIYRTRYNIQIRSVTDAVWEIDLRKCYELLSKLPWKRGARRLALDNLVHNRRMSLTAWLDCKRAGKNDDDFEQLIKYTNMPSHNTYTLLSLNAHELSRQMAADDPEDRQPIVLAAQLCRIIIRALEIKGFRDLQKELGDHTRFDIPKIELTILRTGRLLGTLRWRLALWELVSKGFAGAAFSDRVRKITYVLYFWFLFAKRRLPEEKQSTSPKGDQSTYADVGVIWDDFPQNESPEGFQSWILGSHKQITDFYKLAPVAGLNASGLIEEPVLRQDAANQSSLPEWQMPLGPRKNSYYDPGSGLNYEF